MVHSRLARAERRVYYARYERAERYIHARRSIGSDTIRNYRHRRIARPMAGFWYGARSRWILLHRRTTAQTMLNRVQRAIIARHVANGAPCIVCGAQRCASTAFSQYCYHCLYMRPYRIAVYSENFSDPTWRDPITPDYD